MICVPGLERGIETYRKLGFDIHAGGVHAGKGTHNAIAFNEDDYLEILAIRDEVEYRKGSPYPGLLELIQRGGGMRYIIVQSDDLDADVAAMRARGVDVSDPTPGRRQRPTGEEFRWKSAFLGNRNPLPLFFIQHLTPVAERRRLTEGAGKHPNGVQRFERAYIVMDHAGGIESYSQILGMQPKMETGTVIKANMGIFNLGPTGLGVALPSGPGPAAEALSRQGPGPFQVLLRTKSMDAAARWLADHGVPPPVRGTRNTGEQAMLVTPEHAHGVYIGFVGPA
jgi:hypothetical protein